MIKSAIILAGGMGTRLRSVVSEVPKPMAPIEGRPFLEYQMDYWINQGINRFILSVGYKYDVIQNHFGNIYRGSCIEYVLEDEPKGTGGGLLLAAYDEKLPFVVLNGDTFFRVSLANLFDFHSKQRSSWTFSLFKSNEAGRYMGIEVDNEGKIISLKSGSKDIGCDANGGVYIVDPIALKNLPFLPGQQCSLEDDIVLSCIASGCRVYGLQIDGDFIDIGVPADYYRASNILIR